MVSPIHFQVIPINNWEPLSNYSLNIIRDKIILENGRSIKDSIQTIVISTTKFKKFGSLTGSIAKSDFNPIIARLISYENGNLFYDVLNIEFNMWPWVRNMLKYGDFFLKLDITEKFGVTNVSPISSSLSSLQSPVSSS